jgi:hypothetical protein
VRNKTLPRLRAIMGLINSDGSKEKIVSALSVRAQRARQLAGGHRRHLLLDGGERVVVDDHVHCVF